MKIVKIAACFLCLIFCARSVTARNESSIQDVNSMSYNDSLKVFNEAKQDIEDVRTSIATLEKDIEKSIELQNEKVSIWVSWLMANSLCHGDLNMTGADNLWRQSRRITDEVYKYETRLDKLRSEMEDQILKMEHFKNIFRDIKTIHDRNSEVYMMMRDSDQLKTQYQEDLQDDDVKDDESYGLNAIPGTGDKDKDEDKGMTIEEKKEAERQRQEALRQAERERRKKYKAQNEEREVVRSALREKYNIAAPENEDDCEDDDEDDEDYGGGNKKKEEPETDDPVEQARRLAEKQLNEAKSMAQDKCSLQ